MLASATAALLSLPGTGGIEHEGFVVSQVGGVPEYHWLRIQGADPRTGSLAAAHLDASPSLAALMGGPGALEAVAGRLRAAPSEVIERLSYGANAGPGPGSSAGPARPAAAASACVLMQLLLRDLDSLGWGCLEELDQDAARLTLAHTDPAGRRHRLRLTLPPDYPASAPKAATDLPTPLAFAWRPPGSGGPCGGPGPAQGRGQRRAREEGPGREDGAGSGAGASSSLVGVFAAFKQAVLQLQPLWAALEAIDRRCRVIDPPPSVSAARRHLGPPTRRLVCPALDSCTSAGSQGAPGAAGGGGGGGGGGGATLQLRLNPADPLGPPAPGGAVFLGPPEAVAALREALFGRLHQWSRDRDPVDNLEALLGQPLPPPLGGGPQGAQGGAAPAGDAEDGADALGECAICGMYVLPTEDGEGEGGSEGGSGGGADGVGGGLVPDVVCPTPACSAPFHSACLAEWLRSLPDTRVSFAKLFGRCTLCGNPITVKA
ncbi:hypothetical protein HYH03_004411 [Edaphochlamys debaryana]|uniref:Uncharacterized protein n=1 Tax=Edaphochlamys debaryana TaxID=47281 RepID=A0A835Y7U2_9CHLO|nr:hypothetical protein HYH03_004411 [Edaphochlamys debaryana]|eukprot:KAG2497673.1 hypothetical protein HYH03_004411 [Edaphochlamys debaryana]